jgi:hypothetical protein
MLISTKGVKYLVYLQVLKSLKTYYKSIIIIT